MVFGLHNWILYHSRIKHWQESTLLTEYQPVTITSHLLINRMFMLNMNFQPFINLYNTLAAADVDQDCNIKSYVDF